VFADAFPQFGWLRGDLVAGVFSMNHAATVSEHILVADDDELTTLAVSSVLRDAGYSVAVAEDGHEALHALQHRHFDLAFLDIHMPGLSGLEVLGELRAGKFGAEKSALKAVIMTVDETPESVLRAIREQTLEYLTKPILPEQVLEAVRLSLAADSSLPIEVISARPEWVELLIPCTRDAAERIQSFLSKLDADLSREVRREVGIALRELLLNAVEWGGKFDPTRKVRIAHIRCARMLLYRIADPGAGFSFKNLPHASVGETKADAIAATAIERERLGMRPGGFGIAITQAIADEVVYNETQNEVVFIKYLK
jgi:CheY-like chemotaxis protein/anti-sigma regulatory factor (Ser/Thr protein kinase)